MYLRHKQALSIGEIYQQWAKEPNADPDPLNILTLLLQGFWRGDLCDLHRPGGGEIFSRQQGLEAFVYLDSSDRHPDIVICRNQEQLGAEQVLLANGEIVVDLRKYVFLPTDIADWTEELCGHRRGDLFEKPGTWKIEELAPPITAPDWVFDLIKGSGKLLCYFEGVLTGTSGRQRRAVRFGEIEDAPSVPWVIDGWLLQDGVAILYGESESFKTYMAIHKLLCVATGRPYANREDFEGFSPGSQDNAQEFRSAALGWLIEAQDEHTYDAIIELTENPIFSDSRSRLLAYAEVPPTFANGALIVAWNLRSFTLQAIPTLMILSGS